MSGRYAQGTEVPADRSRAEIEKTLTRYGATSFAYGWDQDAIVVAFQMQGRHIRFRLAVPDPDDVQFWMTPTGKERSPKTARDAYDQATRQRWRALALVIKAKLEAIETGIETLESAFLAQILLPDGRTYGEYAVPQIDRVYQTGEMPSLLPGLRPADVPALGAGR